MTGFRRVLFRSAALVQVVPGTDPQQVRAGEWVEDHYVVVVTGRGTVLCTTDQVLIRPVAR